MHKSKKLSINRCPKHGSLMVSLDDENGGTRLTPGCCGSWKGVKSWLIGECSLDPLLEELVLDRQTTNVKIVYFGCWDRVGHFAYLPGGRRIYGDIKTECDWTLIDVDHIDQVFLGLRDHPFSLIHVSCNNVTNTVLAIAHDNTVDDRPGSNCAFIANGRRDLSTMVDLVIEHFPRIYERHAEDPEKYPWVEEARQGDHLSS